MGLLEKVMVGTGIAAGGVTLLASLLTGKEKKLAKLDEEFEETTREYKSQRSKLAEKAGRGDKRAIKKLKELDDEYAVEKEEYEAQRKKLLPTEKPVDKCIRDKELQHRMEMEKMEAQHQMEMEKMKYLHDHTSAVSEEGQGGNGITCSKCSHANAVGSKFCGGCGAELSVQKFCTGCGAELSPSSKFCNMCGRSVK